MWIRESLESRRVGGKAGADIDLQGRFLKAALADEVLLLSKRPTHVAEKLQFAAARPRTADTTVLPDFIGVKTRALEVFQREVRR